MIYAVLLFERVIVAYIDLSVVFARGHQFCIRLTCSDYISIRVVRKKSDPL